jgi:hypothetical protein
VARSFNKAASETITLNAGNLVNFTASTTIAVVRLAADIATAPCTILCASTGTTPRMLFRIGNATGTDSFLVAGTSAATSTSATPVTAADGWVMLTVAKAAGATAPRMGKYVYSSGVWTLSNGGNITYGTGATGTQIGQTLGAGRFFNGSIAAVATFPRQMSDAELAGLPYSLASWLAAGPAGMWVLDQASTATPVVDWTGGGANQASITGTSVSVESPPIGYGHPIIVAGRASGAEHLFRNQTPAVVNASDGAPGITTATTLRFAADGQVTAIRWFATTTVSGAYTVALWSVDSSDPGTGTLLASTTMSAAPTPGTWNTVPISPVTVTAGALYRASLFSGDGRYVATTGFFGTDVVNGNLTADAHGDTVAGKTISQGTFRINAGGGYPNSPGGGTSYFVDVDFFAGAATATGTATVGLPALTAAVSGTIPLSGAADVTLPAMAASAAGTVLASGLVAATLPALSGAVAGTARTSGTAAGTLPPLTGAAAGFAATAGTAAMVLPALGAAVSGGTGAVAAVAVTLPTLGAAATGTARTSGTAAAALPALTATVTATAATSGTAAAGLPALTATVTGTADTATGTATAVLPALTGTTTGLAGAAGLATVTLPALVAAATATVPTVAAISVVLPALVASASDAPVYPRRPGRFTTGTRRSRLTTGGHR